MSAYLVANNHLTGFEGKAAVYRARVTEIAVGFGGRFLLRGTPMQVLEGQFLARQRNVVSFWRDAAALEAFWFSDVYQNETKPTRAGTSVNDVGLFAGESDPPPPGGSEVYMLVLAQLVGAPAAAYGKAVAALLPRYGGRYLVRGAPQKALEGEWLSRMRVVVSVWPSLAAATDFWNSDAYQKETKPLRDGSGVYDVALFTPEIV